MSENNEPDATKRHVSTPNPAVEGESGQYVTGDYGEAGAVDAGAASKSSGEYATGDYGEAGTQPQGGPAAGQSNDSPEEQDQA